MTIFQYHSKRMAIADECDARTQKAKSRKEIEGIRRDFNRRVLELDREFGH